MFISSIRVSLLGPVSMYGNTTTAEASFCSGGTPSATANAICPLPAEVGTGVVVGRGDGVLVGGRVSVGTRVSVAVRVAVFVRDGVSVLVGTRVLVPVRVGDPVRVAVA